MTKMKHSVAAILLAAILSLTGCSSVEVVSTAPQNTPVATANLPTVAESDSQETAVPEETATSDSDAAEESDVPYEHYYFRNNKLLTQHYEKHGIEMGFDSKEDYEEAACAVINNPDALSKTEKEDGDFVFYVEDTNEFVILSTDGYIRTYFLPSAGIKYYNKQ